MVLTYPDKSLSVNSDHPKKRTIWSRSEIAQGGYFSFKMFAAKFCSLGQRFISIAQANLESYEKSCPQGVFTPEIFLTDIYIYIYIYISYSDISEYQIFPVKTFKPYSFVPMCIPLRQIILLHTNLFLERNKRIRRHSFWYFLGAIVWVSRKHLLAQSQQ